MKQEIIEALKKNEKPFGLMSEELQKAMAKLRNVIGGFEYYSGKSRWEPVGRPTLCEDVVYRLRPDYEPESESNIEEWPIFNKNGLLGYKRNLADAGDLGMDIDLAVRSADFIGFKFEDGQRFVTPIAFRHPDGGLYGFAQEHNITGGEVKVLHASHVLFRRTK